MKVLIEYPNILSHPMYLEWSDEQHLQQGHRLDVTVLKNLKSSSGPECVLLCLQNNCCRSVNYKKRYLPSENSTNCELLHAVAEEHPEQLKIDEHFNHLVILRPTKPLNCSCVSSNDTWYGEKCKKEVPDNLIQIDNGLTTEVWGVDSTNRVFRLEKKNVWREVDGNMTHVSPGEAGIWGVNDVGEVFIREGVSATDSSGTGWKKLPLPMLKQIDSGPHHIVFGVNEHENIFCRGGITDNKPEGTIWRQLSGSLIYVSCGALGCWGVNRHHHVYYRSGVTETNCKGLAWHQIPGVDLTQIEAGLTGDVFGINMNGVVYRRAGISVTTPRGTSWEQISEHASHVTTGLNGQYFLVKGNIFHSP